MKKYCYSIWGQYQCTFAKRILKSQTCAAKTILSLVTQIYSTILRKLKILNYFLIFTNVIYLLLFIYVYNRFCLLVYVKTDNDTYSGKYALTMFTSTKFVITIPIICIFSDNIVRVTSLLLHGVLVQAQ